MRTPVERFTLPPVGDPALVRFPPILRDVLANGLRVWILARPGSGLVSMQVVVSAGSAADPVHRAGLAGVSADMLDEAAGGRDAVELADAFARLGASALSDVGADIAVCGCTVIARHYAAAMALLSDVIVRPHLLDEDLRRVRELRQHRLRQLRTTAAPSADRAFLAAVFHDHPYGHGVMGTTRTLAEMTIDEVRAFHAARYVPSAATLIVSGDITPSEVIAAATSAFGSWTGPRLESALLNSPGHLSPAALLNSPGHPNSPGLLSSPGHLGSPSIFFVDRPAAPQSELRVGHVSPGRKTPLFHALVTLNSALGGQFSSRINANLREDKALTYGARTSFDFRRDLGTFGCDTSVQAEATARAVSEILAEFEAIRGSRPVGDDELSRAKAALTRGFVRGFETADQLVRAATQLVAFDLDDETFDRFVPAVETLGAVEITDAAREFIRPDVSSIVVVGDADTCLNALRALGRPVVVTVPEF